MHLIKVLIFLTFIIINNSLFSSEFNWSKWRGPRADGTSEEKNIKPAMINGDLIINWQKNVGAGYANVAIIDNYLLTLGFNKKNTENILYCFEVDSGKQLWSFSYKASKGRYEGPKSTPVIDNGKIYHLSQDGDLFCNNLQDGKVIWKVNIVNKHQAENLHWFFSSSVLIYKDMAIISASKAGMAFNKNSGKLIWKNGAGKGNYATPVLFQHKNKDLLAIYGADHLYAVEPDSGKITWSYPWVTKYDIIASDPVVYDNKILISSGYGIGSTVIDISSGKPEQLWQHKDLCTHFSTSIIIDGYIYGIDGNAGNGHLKCIDMQTGVTRWSQHNGFGSITVVDGYIIMLNEKGSLIVSELNNKNYKEVARKENILKKLCWTAPVFCRGNVYLRNSKGDIISIKMS